MVGMRIGRMMMVMGVSIIRKLIMAAPARATGRMTIA